MLLYNSEDGGSKTIKCLWFLTLILLNCQVTPSLHNDDGKKVDVEQRKSVG